MNFTPQYRIPMVDFIGRPKTINDAPQDELGAKLLILYALGSLAWDYAGTCRDIVADQRIEETKVLSRKIRKLKEDYDRTRNSAIHTESRRIEKDFGESVEEQFNDSIVKLNYGIANERKVSELSFMQQSLVKSVQMAMTVLDAMALYENDCRAWLKRQGINHSVLLTKHFDELRRLLPGFAGDCYNPWSEARRITAAKLFNKIRNLKVRCKDGFEIHTITER